MVELLEGIFIGIGEVFVNIFGIKIRYFFLKLFNPSLNFEEFSQIKSGWHKFYNACVGLLILFGLIIGVLYLIFLLR